MKLDEGKDYKQCHNRDNPNDDSNFNDDFDDSKRSVDTNKFIQIEKCLKPYKIPTEYLSCALEINPYFLFEPFYNNQTVRYI